MSESKAEQLNRVRSLARSGATLTGEGPKILEAEIVRLEGIIRANEITLMATALRLKVRGDKLDRAVEIARLRGTF